MVQYSYELLVGRRGVNLKVYRLDAESTVQFQWSSDFNSKGMLICRTSRDGLEVGLCDFETFLYPDNVEEDEINFTSVLSGAPVQEDAQVIRLCSLLIAKWSAGHSEESFHETIRQTLKLWTNKTT